MKVLLAAAVLCCTVNHAFAGEMIPSLCPESSVKFRSEGKIKGLAFQCPASSSDSQTVLRISGTFKRQDWVLLKEGDELRMRGPQFQWEQPAGMAATRVEIQAIGPLGEIEETVLFIERSVSQPVTPVQAKSPFGLAIGLAFARLSYSETQHPSYSSFNARLLLNADLRIAEDRFHIEGRSYFDALPFGRSPDRISVRGLGSALQAAYRLPWATRAWGCIVRAGAAFTHMLVSNEAMGILQMSHPFAYPTVTYRLANGKVLSAFIRFVPLSGWGKISFTESSLIAGIGFQNWIFSYESLRLRRIQPVAGEKAMGTWMLGTTFPL